MTRSSYATRTGIRTLLLVAVGVGLLVADPARAQLGCGDILGIQSGDDCTLSTTHTCMGDTEIEIDGDLTITGTGAIDCDGPASGNDGRNLTLKVGGNLLVDGQISANGANGTTGLTNQPGTDGGAGAAIDIDVGGNMTISGTGWVHAEGGTAGSGGSGSGSGAPGQRGGKGGDGGTVAIRVAGAFTLAAPSSPIGGSVSANGSSGAVGGQGGFNGNGGNGGGGGEGGAVSIFSCKTVDEGSISAAGGAGGAGGVGTGAGNGGNGADGADGGTITQQSGTDLILTSTADRLALGGGGGAAGTGATVGNVGGSGEDGAIILDRCPKDGFAIIIEQGAQIDPDATERATAPCCPCALEISKKVALDDDCDGTAEGTFSDSVSQSPSACVVYRICVTNTGDQVPAHPDSVGMDTPQSVSGIQIDDDDIGIAGAGLGDLAPGQMTCRDIPNDIQGDCGNGGGCICSEVEGENTVRVSAGECVVDEIDACGESNLDSVCSDTAEVECDEPGECDVEVTKEACVVPPPGGEGCTGGALAILLKYEGPDITDPVTVEVVAAASGGCDLPSLSNGETVVCPGENGFTFDATAHGVSKLGSKTTIRLRDTGSGQLLAEDILHTSCSCPGSFTLNGETFHTNLVVGEPVCLDSGSPSNPTGQKGYPSPNWSLAGLKDPRLGTILPSEESECSSELPPPQGEACSINKNKITAIQMTYLGGGCANKFFADPKSQNKGKKLKCDQFKGFTPDAEPVRIVAVGKDGKPTWFDSGAANIPLGGSFTILASTGGKKELGGDTTIRIHNTGGTKIEEVKIHTHCHDRFVNVGDIYGGLEVTGVAGTKGGGLNQCPEVEYRYTLASAESVNVRVCDDQLGELASNLALEAGVPETLTRTEQLTLVEGECQPTKNTVRVFPTSQTCPEPADDPEAVDCGSASAELLPPPPAPKQCSGRPAQLTLKYIGPDVAGDVEVSIVASSGATALCSLAGGLAQGQVLNGAACAGQNGFTIDATASGKSDLGTRTSITINGGSQEVLHTSCSCPDSFTVEGQAFHTNLVTGQPACLDSASPSNPTGQKGYPSFFWEVVDLSPSK